MADDKKGLKGLPNLMVILGGNAHKDPDEEHSGKSEDDDSKGMKKHEKKQKKDEEDEREGEEKLLGKESDKKEK